MKKVSGWLALFGHHEMAAGICAGLLAGAAVLAFILPRPAHVIAPHTSNSTAAKAVTAAAAPAPVPVLPPRRYADFGSARENASYDARYTADWIADSRDAAGSAFVIIDKKDAQVYVFDAEARMLGTTPVLLGAAPGDDTVPGIGSRPLAQVLPSERTTPAGRFVGERGHNARGEDVVWVDYDAAVSMHRVITSNPAERRLERLATPTKADNRVSYGCINVPVAFYESYLRPTFATHRAIVYVLPEFKSLDQVFGSYDVAAADGMRRNEAQETPNGALKVGLGALRSFK